MWCEQTKEKNTAQTVNYTDKNVVWIQDSHVSSSVRGVLTVQQQAHSDDACNNNNSYY